MRLTWALLLSSQQTTILQSFFSKEKEVRAQQCQKICSDNVTVWVHIKGNCMSFLQNIEYCFSSKLNNTAQNVGALKSEQSLPTHITCIQIILAQRHPRQWPGVCCSKPAIQSNFTHSLSTFYLPSDIHFGGREFNNLRHHPAAILHLTKTNSCRSKNQCLQNFIKVFTSQTQSRRQLQFPP